MSVDDPEGLVALVDEVELATDAQGRLAGVLVDGVDHTDDVRAPAVECGSLGGRRGARGARAPCSSASAISPRVAASSWPAATSGRSCCPTPTSSSILDASVEERARRRDRGARPRPGRAGGRGDPRGAPAARSTGLDARRGTAPDRTRRPDHHHRRQRVRGHGRRGRRRDPRRRGAPRPPKSAAMTDAGAEARGPAPIDSSITPLIAVADVRGPDLRAGMTRVSVEGAIDEIPREGPVILAANHASNLDAVVLGAWLIPKLGRRIHWLGKKELFDWPVVGWAAAHGGVHPVDRGSADVEAFRLAKRILDEGNMLFVFPEGTRSPDGALQEARDGVALLALRTGAPIVPVGIAGLAPGLAAGPEAAAARWPRHGPCRAPVPPRRRSCRPDVDTARARRHGPGHRRCIMPPRSSRRLLPPKSTAARRLRPTRREGPNGPRAIIEPWERSRKSASRSAPGSATAFARRSTRPRRRRPPARRRIPSARSSTTRASSATSRTWASRRSRSLDDVDHGAAVVIRAHGVRPDVMERAKERGLEVIDGTCTWVIQEQRELVKLVEEGYTIVLLGTPKHPEVVGLLGFAPDAIVVDEEEEWEAAIPRQEADGAHQPVDPAALEVRAARRVHGLARPRAQDRQHRLPGHDPPPAGHARGGAARST